MTPAAKLRAEAKAWRKKAVLNAVSTYGFCTLKVIVSDMIASSKKDNVQIPDASRVRSEVLTIVKAEELGKIVVYDIRTAMEHQKRQPIMVLFVRHQTASNNQK